LDLFRYHGFKSFAEVDSISIAEYELLMQAARLKEVDRDYRNHLQAFLCFAVQATKGKKNKPVFTKFKKFYDYEQALEKAKIKDDKKSRFSGFGKFLKKGV
jgi:hypothetical protein